MRYLFCNNVPQDQWIGRGGIKEWPPRSASLTSYDLFLWSWTKFEVYQSKQGYLMKWRNIFAHFSAVTLEFLRKALSVFLPGCRCVQNAGAYVEI
jgi:hypothetical protein